jgi:hypothetical protein
MGDERKRSAVETDFNALPQLIRSWTQRRQITFEVQIPSTFDLDGYAEGLYVSFHRGMPEPHERSEAMSITMKDPDPPGSRGLQVIYKPDRYRNIDEDQKQLVECFREGEVSITPAAAKGIDEAFAAFKAMRSKEHGNAVASELARRGADISRARRGR